MVECSADRIGDLRALVDDFTIDMMALPVAHLGRAMIYKVNKKYLVKQMQPSKRVPT